MLETVYSFGKRSCGSILSHAINHCHISNTRYDGGLGIVRSPAIPIHECRKARIKHLPKARVEIPHGRRMPSLNRYVFTKLIVSQAKHLLLIGWGGGNV